jgi:hypothetical protein
MERHCSNRGWQVQSSKVHLNLHLLVFVSKM